MLIYNIIISIFTILLLIITVAIFTLAERKIMASVQRRRGPNVVGLYGLLQPLVDGLKLLFKETSIPFQSNKIVFLISPALSLFLSLLNWVVIPFNSKSVIVNLELGVIFVLAISSIGVYGVLFSGWSSNSKYALLGSIRSISQMISYEVCLSLCFFPVILCSGSLNFNQIIFMQKNIWYIFPMLPIGIIFFICMLAETQRVPFDLPEAEAELVAGFALEYSAIVFAFFFLGEYCNIIFMSTIFSILFFGGWLFPIYLSNSIILESYCLAFKTVIFCILFIFVRANLPRYRFDILLLICWKNLMPFCLMYLIFCSGILIYFDCTQISLL